MAAAISLSALGATPCLHTILIEIQSFTVVGFLAQFEFFVQRQIQALLIQFRSLLVCIRQPPVRTTLLCEERIILFHPHTQMFTNIIVTHS